jgi:hypothetical protein
MLYDLNFLQRGREFPPKSEVKRLDAYRVNGMLLDDEAWAALPDYKERVFFHLANFSLPSERVYLFSANYWADIVAKMKELIFGVLPEVTVDGEDEAVQWLLHETDFMEKAKEGAADLIALGDWVTKIVETPTGWDFINVDPSTWFPIVSRENVKQVIAHVLAWIAPIDGDRYELQVQVHEKGKYTNRAFAVKSFNPDAYYVVQTTKQKVYCPSYEIGEELKESKTGFVLGEHSTGLDDFAVMASANNPSTRKICGSSDFDYVTDAIMEYNVRQTLKNVVLDKHSAPKMYGPPIEGDKGFGNYLEIPPGGTTPNYLVWDASMQSVGTTIEGLKNDIANLSGLGSLLHSNAFGESQGYDALMIKLAPALMRSAEKRSVLEKHFNRLISALFKRYAKSIEPTEISVIWHDGIPTTESVRADIAQKHINTGWSYKRVLMTDYGFDELTADAIIEEKRLETPGVPAFGADEGGDDF